MLRTARITCTHGNHMPECAACHADTLEGLIQRGPGSTKRLLCEIEHRNASLRSEARSVYARGRERGCVAFCAAVAGCYEADRDLLRKAWEITRSRLADAVVERSPLMDDKRRVAFDGHVAERTVREDLLTIDVLRENHLLAQGSIASLWSRGEAITAAHRNLPVAMKRGVYAAGEMSRMCDEDDLMVAHHGDQLANDDAAAEVEWTSVTMHEAGTGYESEAFRLTDWRGGVETSSEQEASYEDALFVARKRRTHRVPADLDVPRDPLMLSEGERLTAALLDHLHRERISDRIWEAVMARTTPEEIAYRWDEDGVLVNDPGLEEIPLQLIAPAPCATRTDLVEVVQIRAAADIDRLITGAGHSVPLTPIPHGRTPEPQEAIADRLHVRAELRRVGYLEHDGTLTPGGLFVRSELRRLGFLTHHAAPAPQALAYIRGVLDLV